MLCLKAKYSASAFSTSCTLIICATIHPLLIQKYKLSRLRDILQVSPCPTFQVYISLLPEQVLPLLGIEAVATLQLLDQLDIVLLGSRGCDFVFDGNLLPGIVLVLLLYAAAIVNRPFMAR